MPNQNVESFAERLASIKAAWEERTRLEFLAHHTDRDSQFEYLLLFHAWCREAVEAIRLVYGASLMADAGPGPEREDASPSMSVSIGDFRVITAWIEESPAASEDWRVCLASRSCHKTASWMAVRPNRAHRLWTKAQAEDLLLSEIVSFERERHRSRTAGMQLFEADGSRTARNRRPTSLSSGTRRNDPPGVDATLIDR